MKPIALCSLPLAGLVLLCQGCVTRIVEEGIEKTLGPTARTLPMEPKLSAKGSRALAGYQNFELALPLNSEFADTPREFLSYFPGKLAEQMADKGLPMGQPGKTLLIRVTILAYQPASTFHKAIGPTEEVVARVELADKDSSQVVGRAICIGRTYQTVGLGVKWKAWGLCRAIVNDWLDDYYPKGGRLTRAERPPAD